jgi:hypothetical protein
MAKALTVKRVEKLLRAGVPGKHTDADVRGLMLAVESKTSAAWLLRWHATGAFDTWGWAPLVISPWPRQKARRERERIANGTDPLELKRKDRVAQREAEARLLTFRQAAERCHAAREAGWSNAAHAAEFIASLERYVFPHIGNLDVAAVGKDEVLQVLEQKLPNRMGKGESGGVFWTTKTVTADRVRSRVQQVLDWAEARGYRTAGTPNPCRWRGFRDVLLPAPRKVAPVRHMRSVRILRMSPRDGRFGGRSEMSPRRPTLHHFDGRTRLSEGDRGALERGRSRRRMAHSGNA